MPEQYQHFQLFVCCTLRSYPEKNTPLSFLYNVLSQRETKLCYSFFFFNLKLKLFKTIGIRKFVGFVLSLVTAVSSIIVPGFNVSSFLKEGLSGGRQLLCLLSS